MMRKLTLNIFNVEIMPKVKIVYAIRVVYLLIAGVVTYIQFKTVNIQCIWFRFQHLFRPTCQCQCRGPGESIDSNYF